MSGRSRYARTDDVDNNDCNDDSGDDDDDNVGDDDVGDDVMIIMMIKYHIIQW